MAKQVKFTFKLDPKLTGLMAVGNSERGATVKLNGKKVGSITAPNWMSKTREFTVSFAVKKTDPENPNVKWEWVRLKHRTMNVDDMKIWLNTMAAAIVEKYDLHSFDH